MKPFRKKSALQTESGTACEATETAVLQEKKSAEKEYVFAPDDFTFVKTEEAAVDTNFSSQGYWKGVFTRFFKKKISVFGLICIGVIVLLAIFVPLFSSYSYDEVNVLATNMAPRVPFLEKLGIFNGWETIRTVTGESTKVNKYLENGMTDKYFLFGTDELGRDIWTRTWYGARISLIIAIVATVIDMIIGMSYGLVSGYFGGVTDGIMQRVVEIINGIPRLVVVILLSLAMKPGLGAIIVALLITEWIGMSRISRAEMLRLKDREYILASRTLGAGNMSIIFKGVLPNIVGPVITQVMFSIPTAIFTEAFLSFVGLGVRLPECSLGSLISDGFQVFNTHPYQIMPPIIILALLMLSFNLVGDGLREALDPKMKDM